MVCMLVDWRLVVLMPWLGGLVNGVFLVKGDLLFVLEGLVFLGLVGGNCAFVSLLLALAVLLLMVLLTFPALLGLCSSMLTTRLP